MTIQPLLRVENLRTAFHTKAGVARAVDGITLELKQGQTLGLIGESGCGKSVTALSIMGLVDPPGRIDPTSSIALEGRELVGLREKELRRVRGNEIAMVFQEPMTSLNPVYTVGRQISEAIRAHSQADKKQARERTVELLRLVGIPSAEKRIDAFPFEMSGGMRQRVVIAIALACDPKVLIADEPTTALDVTIQAQILALLADLRERLDMAVLLITHDLGVVAQVAEDVAVMYAGKIVETGPIEAVFEDPQHPYTEALLRSIPMLGMSQDEPLTVVPGSVPSPLAWPAGCRFAERCRYAYDACSRREPELFTVGSQTSACLLCEDGRRDADRPGIGGADVR